MGKEDKGQVSVFIIIAIIFIILIILGFIAYQTNLITIGSSKIHPDVSSVYDRLSSCIKQRSIDALGLVGLQGGYVLLPPAYLETNISNVAFALHNQKNTLISLKEMERQIESYIDLTVPYCIQEIEELDIKPGKAQSHVTIINDVKISVSFPLSVSKGASTYTLKNPYEYSFDIRLKKIHETANEIINKQLENREYVDLTFLSDLEPHTSFIYVDDKNGLYVITDEQSILDDIEYSFMFGVELR